MICKRCGAEIPDWFIICGICGTPVAGRFGRKKNSGREDIPDMLPPERTRAEEVNRQRIPYRQNAGRNEMRDKERFSGLSFRLGLISLFLLWIPFASLPLSIMAVIFGIIGLRKGEPALKRAVCGIAFGAAALLFGITMSTCIAMLMPYAEDINHMMEEYMNHR